MNVTFHEGFTKNLDHLDGSLKAKAWDFVTKLNKDPDATGLDLKLPHLAQDRRVRTARVDRNYRAVLFLVGEGDARQLVLAAIKPHDEAYAFAASATMKVNITSGAIELRVVDVDTQGHLAQPDASPTPTAPTSSTTSSKPEQDARQCLPFTVAELNGLGIDQAIAVRAVLLTDDAELLGLVEDLPKWQSSILLDLADGRSLADVSADYVITAVDPEHADTDEAIREALARPSSQMEFAVVTDDDDLRRMLAGDFADWRVFLHPTQRSIAYRPVYNGPFRLSGGAGTGKTVVALHRARHLAASDSGARVLLATFNRALASQLKKHLLQLTGAELAERIDVLGVDQLARQVVVQASGSAGVPIDDRSERDLWDTACAAADLDANAVLTPQFVRDEHRYVIAAQGISDERSYLTAPRRGRGVRLDRGQRRQVWKAVEEFAALLHQEQKTTFLQLAIDAADALSGKTGASGAVGVRHYDHIVIDEGQDLQPVHWRMLRSLVPAGPNDLFLCEDGHQRLYGQRVILSRLDIETRGRSRRLTLNYRTTQQILNSALAILHGTPVEDLEGDLDTTDGYRSTSQGPLPRLVSFPSREQENAAIVSLLHGWLDAIPAPGPGTIGVLARRKRDVTALFGAVTNAGITARLVSGETKSGNEAIHVLTMHTAKGNEFQRVIVAYVDDSTVPDAYAIRSAGPDGQDDALAREKFLLYVACSRARDQLVLSWTGAPSRFLMADDIATRDLDRKHRDRGRQGAS